MSLLGVTDLSCHFETRGGLVRALDGVSLQLGPGETLALVGESGCGKSTLAKVILGLAPRTGGNVTFDGVDTATFDRAARRAYRRRVQAVFQDPYSSLNPRLRIGKIVGEPLRAHGVRGAALNARIGECLEMVGLATSAGMLYPHEFSGGQRQRIAIARALALQPDVIVLDEPISALDVSIRAQILNLLQDLQDELGLAYLLIAHDLALVEHASDRVAVMYLGRIVEEGDVEPLFANPSHPYTQTLLSAVPRPDPRSKPDASLVRGEVASPLAPPAGCHFHPRCAHADTRCGRDTPRAFSTTAGSATCWLLEQT